MHRPPRRALLLQALAVVAVAVLALGLVWRELAARHEGLLRESFEFESRRLVTKIQERMRAYSQVLRGAAGLVAASDDVSRDEWHRYVERLEMHDDYRGIQGVGFSVLVPPSRLRAHEESIRREGFPDDAIRPAGEREVYSSIIYLEPFRDRNLRAFGYDMYSEPVRRAAMERARDTGEIAYSGKVQLVQETSTDVRAGMLVYQPVYAGGEVPDTVARRRERLVGWAYSPFRMKDLMDAMLRADLATMRLEIFDGEGTTPESLLFDSHPGRREGGESGERGLGVLGQAVLEGRTWTLRFTALPEFAAAARIDPPWVAFLAAATLGLLIAGTVWAFVRSRRQQAVVAALAESLRESEEALNQAQQVAGIGSWTLEPGPEGRMRWSREIYRLMDLEPGLPVTRESILAHVPEEDRAAVAGAMARAAAGEPMELEHRLVVGGTTRWVHVIAAPHAAAPGRAPEVIGTVQDVTERRRMLEELQGHRNHLEGLVAERTRELEAAKNAAEAGSRAKTQLLANMSHEIRTPMNAIVGLTALVRRDVREPEQVDRMNRVTRAAEHLLRMIEDILEMTRMDSGTVVVQAAPFGIDDLATRSLHRTGESATEKGLVLGSAVDPGLHVLYLGDADRLGRILENFLGNAVKFTEVGRVDLEVRLVERRPDGDLLRFAVRDTGIGIAPEVRDRLFQPFEQADSSMTRQYGGAGLGLAICRRFADAMGGRIGVESSPGEGSLFWLELRLPRFDLPEDEKPPAAVPPVPGQPDETPAAAPTAPPAGPPRVPPVATPVAAMEATADEAAALELLRRQPGLDVDAGLHSVRGRPASYLRLLRKLADSHRDDVARNGEMLAAGQREDAR
ncbi:MAG: CHASE domain-containing protein, partial [Rhodocyclaceae bacterium]|nr:CHASE domain-containing protein [Rhodocyclaceae bacterium]